jgi:WhiB family redox-sensing transcriptional regulator
MEWQSRAACRNLGPLVFFGPADEPSNERLKREAQAKAICKQCDVVADCLVAGQGEEGIWGGMTDSDRRRQTQRSRYAPMRSFTIVEVKPREETDAAPWTALESSGRIMLFRRDSSESWHGSEFLIVRDGIVIQQTEDLNTAYARYASLIE